MSLTGHVILNFRIKEKNYTLLKYCVLFNSIFKE